jgi:aspartyl-tRNA(Asn)/glutamyl-tRNA(Gln) amidotransferase subunit A
MDAWRNMTAADLGREIAAGRIDPVALTEGFLDAIDAHVSGADIYARTTPGRARSEAEAARDRARNGLSNSPLDGVPISWKDLFDTAGVATESGSALLKGRVPEADAEVLANATHAGLVCLGKTHQTELAFSGLGLNPVTATPPCINDAEAVPGGSSSGAAASTAHGLAAAGIGSDTGGSVRVPSAWNDLVGLKTSTGTLSNRGVVPLAPRFDTVGPLARSVEDAALLYAVMAGTAAPDLTGATASGLRLAALTTIATEDLREAPARAHEDALRRLSTAGVEITEIAVPAVAEAMDLAGLIFASEAYAVWGAAIEANPDVMFPPVRERFRSGRDHAAHSYIAGWRRLDALRAAYADATSGFDAVIVPTVALLPPKKAALEADHAFFSSENLLALRNTRIGNLMDCTVVTLPTGHPSCGLSVMVGPRQEARVLRLAAALEPVLAG